MTGKTTRTLACLIVVLLTTAACGSLNPFKAKEAPPLPGERLSVLKLDTALRPDPRIADLSVTLPRPQTNADWPQPGGYPDHAMQHLSLGDSPGNEWEASVGSGSSSERRIMAQPVVAAGKVFTMDAKGEVRAFEAASGNRLWSRNVLPEEEEEGDLGGGVAYAEGRLFVTTGAAEVLCLDPESGEVIWRQSVGGPMRSGPTVADGRVFVVTVENELVALAAKDGRRLWSHVGLTETAGVLGGASPAVARGIVVVPHSSGEIFALRAENGRPVWSEGLASVRRVNAVSTLADIRGHPVIDRGTVYAVSHSGRMVAIDLRSGARIWEVDIGALQTPWVAGDFIFVVTTRGWLAAIMRDTGRVRWVTDLERFVDKDDAEDGVVWAGPVLAGDRLIVAGSHGEALSISPYTGNVTGMLKLSEGVQIAPVVANNTLYFLDEDGSLVAKR
jgi:outer membrane protein assembly factor BamB